MTVALIGLIACLIGAVGGLLAGVRMGRALEREARMRGGIRP